MGAFAGCLGGVSDEVGSEWAFPPIRVGDEATYVNEGGNHQYLKMLSLGEMVTSTREVCPALFYSIDAEAGNEPGVHYLEPPSAVCLLDPFEALSIYVNGNDPMGPNDSGGPKVVVKNYGSELFLHPALKAIWRVGEEVAFHGTGESAWYRQTLRLDRIESEHAEFVVFREYHHTSPPFDEYVNYTLSYPVGQAFPDQWAARQHSIAYNANGTYGPVQEWDPVHRTLDWGFRLEEFRAGSGPAIEPGTGAARPGRPLTPSSPSAAPDTRGLRIPFTFEDFRTRLRLETKAESYFLEHPSAIVLQAEYRQSRDSAANSVEYWWVALYMEGTSGLRVACSQVRQPGVPSDLLAPLQTSCEASTLVNLQPLDVTPMPVSAIPFVDLQTVWDEFQGEPLPLNGVAWSLTGALLIPADLETPRNDGYPVDLQVKRPFQSALDYIEGNVTGLVPVSPVQGAEPTQRGTYYGLSIFELDTGKAVSMNSPYRP